MKKIPRSFTARHPRPRNLHICGENDNSRSASARITSTRVETPRVLYHNPLLRGRLTSTLVERTRGHILRVVLPLDNLHASGEGDMIDVGSKLLGGLPPREWRRLPPWSDARNWDGITSTAVEKPRDPIQVVVVERFTSTLVEKTSTVSASGRAGKAYLHV